MFIFYVFIGFFHFLFHAEAANRKQTVNIATRGTTGIRFIKMSDRDLKFVYLFCQTDTFLFVIETPIRKCKHQVC
jgi:hypothetical protein